MEKFVLTWEKGKGYTMVIDNVAFEKTTKAFLIEAHSRSAPNITLELYGDGYLYMQETENK